MSEIYWHLITSTGNPELDRVLHSELRRDIREMRKGTERFIKEMEL